MKLNEIRLYVWLRVCSCECFCNTWPADLGTLGANTVFKRLSGMSCILWLSQWTGSGAHTYTELRSIAAWPRTFWPLRPHFWPCTGTLPDPSPWCSGSSASRPPAGSDGCRRACLAHCYEEDAPIKTRARKCVRCVSMLTHPPVSLTCSWAR